MNLLAVLDEQRRAVTLWQASSAAMMAEIARLDQMFHANLLVMQACLETIATTTRDGVGDEADFINRD